MSAVREEPRPADATICFVSLKSWESARRLRTLRVLADDFDSAFLPLPSGDDAEFRRQTSAYQAALDAALAAAPQDCAALASAVGPVGDACKACHRDFRN